MAGASELSLAERVQGGLTAVRQIVGKVWPYILAGIAVGAGIHGYVPEDFMASFMGKEAWWSVPLAVFIGVPMYTNAAGVIPIVQALLAKGAALGTVLAFMMSVIALSLPEMIILRKVLKPQLIATFVGVVAVGTGCSNCKATVALIEQIAQAKGIAITMQKIEEIQDIMAYGVMSTPGVVLDGKVVHAGGVPSRDKVEQWLS